jgi:hypothetical protein
MIVVTDKVATFQLLEESLGLRWTEDFRGAMFVPDVHRGEVASKAHVGVAVSWSNFVGKTCTLSILVQKPECLTRTVIREIFRFPFEVCGCVAILAMVDSKNLASINLCNRSGFKAVHRVIDGGSPGADLIIFQMDRASCRWLRRTH